MQQDALMKVYPLYIRKDTLFSINLDKLGWSSSNESIQSLPNNILRLCKVHPGMSFSKLLLHFKIFIFQVILLRFAFSTKKDFYLLIC